jgi:hypothetical protein
MKKNIGKTDKIIRIVLGVVILSQTVVGLGSLWGLIGLVLIVTALIDFCPAYTLLGINTRNIKDKLGMS